MSSGQIRGYNIYFLTMVLYLVYYISFPSCLFLSSKYKNTPWLLSICSLPQTCKYCKYIPLKSHTIYLKPCFLLCCWTCKRCTHMVSPNAFYSVFTWSYLLKCQISNVQNCALLLLLFFFLALIHNATY